MHVLKSRSPGRKRKPMPITLHRWEGPTPERIRHVENADTVLVVDAYRTDAGEETQLKRMRIVSPLEQLWKAGILDSGQFGAARRYQRDADLAALMGPAATVRYEPRMIDLGTDPSRLLPIEKAADYLARLAAAQAVCGPKRRRMLDWIATEPCGARQQARLWFPDASELWARASFKRVLCGTCDALEAHYKRAA